MIANITIPSFGSYKWKLDDDKEWYELSLKRMLGSYGEEDFIYDDYK